MTSQASLGAGTMAREGMLEHTWSRQLQGAPSPVQRVVKLLEEMKAEIEKEAAKDQELYDQMVCWCETSEKEKTKAVADADAKDKDLVSEIEERSAKHGVLSTNIDAAKVEIKDETAALAEAMEIREKDAGSFRTEEKEMIQAITNLKNAILVLGKHHSLMQTDGKIISSLGSVLRNVALTHETLLGYEEKPRRTRKALQTVLLSVGSSEMNEESMGVAMKLRGALNVYDGKESSFEMLPAKFAERVLAHEAHQARTALIQETSTESKQSYAPASGAIFGILKQMKEEFETNLASTQKEEAQAAEDYNGLKDSKEKQLAATKDNLEAMQSEYANNKKAKYDAKEDLELTREQRTEDVNFLRKLKTVCGDLDHQWEQRSKMRSEEIKAVAETITILTEDDARDLMSKTVTFVQVKATTGTAARMRAMRSRASAVLRRTMMQPSFDDLLDAWHGRQDDFSESPKTQLAQLTVSVQLDAFTKVKEAMDQMVAELKQQQAEEVKTKEFCTAEFNENEKQTYTKTEEKKDAEVNIDGLSATIEKLTKAIESANKQIADTRIEVKKASQQREEENAEYQTTVSDQRATQTILKKALARLNKFYKKKALLQEAQEQVPPVQFKPMKKSAGASPVISMIEQIIEESIAVEAEAVKAEAEAQKDYEQMVSDSNKLIKELTTAVTEKTKAKSEADSELVSAQADHKSLMKELEDLAAVKADLHEQCDFLLKNFDIRQKARLQEMEAISEAKGILSGAMSM